MKKLISRIALCIAIFSILFQFTSCQKDILVDETTNSSKDLVFDLQLVTNDYLDSQQLTSNADYKKPKWLQILQADLSGAVAGFLSTGNQNLAIMMGALASIKGAEREGLPGNPEGTDVLLYTDNSYDYVGKQHYQIIAVAASNPDQIFDGSVLNYENYLDFVTENLGLQMPECNEYREKCSCLYTSGVIDNFVADDFSIISYINEIDITENEKSILVNYMLALEGTENTDDFVQYSIDIEEGIISSELTDTSKAFLLSIMSTARIGVAYWN